jgi:uncharacterized protein
VIGSPSLWWNDRAIFAAEASYAASTAALPARVFFSVGSLEQLLAPRYPMVTDLQAFVHTLEKRRYEGLRLRSYVFDGETHVSVIPGTISKGLRFIYAGDSSRQEPSDQPRQRRKDH